jgi:hypothetical protein
MAQNRLPDNEHFPKQQTFLLLIVALIWSLRPDTWDASGEKSCAREPPYSRRIPGSRLASFGNAGNGDYRGELLRARAVISTYATRLALPLSHVLVRLDGLYGNAAPLADLLAPGGPGVVVRGKDYHLLDLPAVSARLQLPPDQQTRHPESQTSRALYDCPNIALTPTGPVVRMLVAARQVADAAPSIGTLRNGTVYEQFFTTVPPNAFTPADVLDLYLHRGSFETVRASEDQEQDPDRWVSHTPCGQEFWQIIAQW